MKVLTASCLLSALFSQALGENNLRSEARRLDVFAKLDKALPDIDISSIVPVFDFDGDGCLPETGISRAGVQNPGRNPGGSVDSGCRANNFLDSSNTFHRYVCKTSNGDNYCAHIFALYFEKDQAVWGSSLGGHKNDWEHASIWTKNGAVTHASYSAHGDLYTSPIGDLGAKLQNGHVKFVYHKDGIGTHAMRFAKDNEVAENQYGTFVTMDIVSWFTMKGDGLSNQDMRNRLNVYDYGSAHLPIRDDSFYGNVNNHLPAGYPTF